jgi:hypothetical protein
VCSQLTSAKSVSNFSYVNRNGPCNVLSVIRVHEVPKDLQASLAAGQQASVDPDTDTSCALSG